MKLLLPFLLACNLVFAQHQEREVLLYNIGLGGFASALGAVINTPKGGKWKQNVIKSFWQGSIGGVLRYTGKKTLYLINEKQQLLYAWPARIQHAAGTSIIDNAAMNQPFLQNWNMVIGPVRLDYCIHGESRFRVRLLPATAWAIAAGCYSGDLNMNVSLLTGDLAFRGLYNILPSGANGLSYGRGFSYVDDDNRYHTIAHELVHEFQYQDYQFLNSYLSGKAQLVKPGMLKKLFSKYLYFDIPYFPVTYRLMGKYSLSHPFSIFYEFEAERLSTNAFVNRN